jgi:hypothetical protein
MLNRAGAAIVGALMKALTIVLLFVLLISLIHWAKANPDKAQTLLNGAIDTAANVIGWVFEQIDSAIASA